MSDDMPGPVVHELTRPGSPVVVLAALNNHSADLAGPERNHLIQLAHDALAQARANTTPDAAPDRPRAAVIEIVEQRPAPDGAGYGVDLIGADIIVPNEVRLNGQPLLMADQPIKIHETAVGGRRGDCVLVTLTLFARRVVISHEDAPQVNA